MATERLDSRRREWFGVPVVAWIASVLALLGITVLMLIIGQQSDKANDATGKLQPVQSSVSAQSSYIASAQPLIDQLNAACKLAPGTPGAPPASVCAALSNIPSSVPTVSSPDTPQPSATAYIAIPGPSGPSGTSGTSGTDGTNGQPGGTGQSGVNGTNGTDGATVTGPAGPKGDTGDQGVPGADGSPGIAGIQGPGGPGFTGAYLDADCNWILVTTDSPPQLIDLGNICEMVTAYQQSHLLPSPSS